MLWPGKKRRRRCVSGPSFPIISAQTSPTIDWPLALDMDTSNWTTTHDLAVVYIALAYGTDHDLSDGELLVLTEALQAWKDLEEPAIQEIIVEAATLFVESDAEAEVRRAMKELRATLSPQERRDTVRYLIRIAEADGVLLEREQGFIHTLAEAWSLKQLSEELLKDTSAVVQRRGENWGLIHELAFLYILVGHSAGDELSSDTIDVVQERLQEWQPDLSGEEIQEVVRRALQVYADQPEESLIYDSVEALKEALPSTQRLTVLDDLHTVAQADGPLTRDERQLITSLAQAWDLNIRMNGHG
ncbi:MAG: TerB family tellurite resistance protein [Bacteroidetes bacterium SW_11_64_17]|nr:MAG: TerB family tellurite resistance protein [Bacteroidetes bacterium SW_11_64_17]